jgi:bifunctional UDP-N-acetylglucosamine pyrophosphorylase/glucosamine-1-phosphate N-acetyltransferase
MAPSDSQPVRRTLGQAVALSPRKILNPACPAWAAGLPDQAPVLVILAAGKGTRFGQEPKCIQPVRGVPLARHSIDAFRRFSPSPVIALVGYRHADVAAALGADNLYVVSDNPAGGTAFAAYEAFCAPGLEESDPLLIITMGDRIVPDSLFRRLWEAHREGGREADLTFLTAQYEPPRNTGKGRVLRDESGRVRRLIEEKDIAAEKDELARQALHNLTEGNCPLYAIRARRLKGLLEGLTNENAQEQYYITDIIAAISAAGGEIRTITTTPAEPEYDLLVSDVTKPLDLALLEKAVAEREAGDGGVEAVARQIEEDHPPGQVASIARQLEELAAGIAREKIGYRPALPVGIGMAGGRLRLAFMHPDMARFYGPAWQMPIGAGAASGDEQIVMLLQGADDQRLHLYPMDPKYRESINDLPSDADVMYPGEGVADMHAYEAFGTRMSEALLLSLGYFSDAELDERRRRGQPLPPSSLWVSSNMRRPFALVGNAIASMRTLREGHLGLKVREFLGRENFKGLRVVCTGGIPKGGFSSSSAVTVAVKNALNALYDLGIPADLLVHLACQAEFGTGVRAGSLDQATEQKGRTGQGALISSNPRDHYRILGTFPVPADRFRILFPFSVERDREAWRWSWGFFAESAGGAKLTAGEWRKLTGKAAELAAVLVRLPLDTSFFKRIEEDLLADGLLGLENRAWIAGLLRGIPLRIGRDDLKARVMAERGWYRDQLAAQEKLEEAAAERKAETALASLFDGWREPEGGVPLRAMLAYLFGEVAKNAWLVHHPETWIASVQASQLGDRCVELDPERLPARAEMERELEWEKGAAGPARLERWLERFGGRPFDIDGGLGDAELAGTPPPEFHTLAGSNFFRGLALIDLAEAMLRRAFGSEAVAVRVNAAGQGDFFQVHVDARLAEPEQVKAFIRKAFYGRFGLKPDPEFVEPHPGGGAFGVRLARYDQVPELVRRLRQPGKGG